MHLSRPQLRGTLDSILKSNGRRQEHAASSQLDLERGVVHGRDPQEAGNLTAPEQICPKTIIFELAAIKTNNCRSLFGHRLFRLRSFFQRVSRFADRRLFLACFMHRP